MPAVDLDPLLDGRRPLPPLAFRRVLVTCPRATPRPSSRAGRSAPDETGQVYLVPCRPGARRAWPGGCGSMPAGRRATTRSRGCRSTASSPAGSARSRKASRSSLTAATAAAAARAERCRPAIETIPNNHLLYAFQWFFFAAAAVVIYVLALRGRRAPRIAAGAVSA